MSLNARPDAAAEPNLDKARFNMIEQQVRPWDVVDPAVLALLAAVPRDAFAPEAFRALAYADLALPLTQPTVDGECMLPPKVQARLLQDAAVQPGETVLHIGTGSGYLAALLGKQAKSVRSLEINPALATRARSLLSAHGVTNVEVVTADAAADGFKACGTQPVNVIVLSGSVAEVPDALLNRLTVGGRLVAIVGQEPIMRARLITRTAEAGFSTEEPWDFVAPRLLNFPEPSAFRF